MFRVAGFGVVGLQGLRDCTGLHQALGFRQLVVVRGVAQNGSV